jgi:hypothetical protein
VVRELFERSVIFGAGGGGDVVSAYVLCELLRSTYGIRECLPGAVLWERWVVDPYPGPVPRHLIRGARVGECVYVGPGTYVERSGRVVRLTSAAVAEVAGVEVPAVTLERGALGVRRCFDELAAGGWRVALVDVGGDVLARGSEEGLWSPLADSISLAAASGVGAPLVVLAPGADGELDPGYVVSRVAEVQALGGLYGVVGLWVDLVGVYERVLPRVASEASRVPYAALRGLVSGVSMRGGSRRAYIGPLSLVGFAMSSRVVAELSPLARAVAGSRSLAEAWKALNSLGVVTELDVEVELAKLVGCGREASGSDYLRAREAALRRVRGSATTPGTP